MRCSANDYRTPISGLEPMPVPDGPSKRGSLDFVSDVYGPARRFRMLNVIDDYPPPEMPLESLRPWSKRYKAFALEAASQ